MIKNNKRQVSGRVLYNMVVWDKENINLEVSFLLLKLIIETQVSSLPFSFTNFVVGPHLRDVRNSLISDYNVIGSI